MSKEDKKTTVAGLEKTMYVLGCRVGQIEGDLKAAKLSSKRKQCKHKYLKIEIENDGYLRQNATCLDCKKCFSLRKGFDCERAVKKIHKQLLK